jgi:replication-associated recombination protein RarA
VDYQYSHLSEENVSGQEFMIDPQSFYEAKKVGAETDIAQRLERWQRLKIARKASSLENEGE